MPAAQRGVAADDAASAKQIKKSAGRLAAGAVQGTFIAGIVYQENGIGPIGIFDPR